MTKCRKCRRLIALVEECVLEADAEIKVRIIDQIDEMMQYNTFLLPALFINGKIVSRGYVPEKARVCKEIKELMDN